MARRRDRARPARLPAPAARPALRLPRPREPAATAPPGRARDACRCARPAGRPTGYIVEIVGAGDYEGVLSELDDVVSRGPRARPEVVPAHPQRPPTVRRVRRATSCGSRSRRGRCGSRRHGSRARGGGSPRRAVEPPLAPSPSTHRVADEAPATARPAPPLARRRDRARRDRAPRRGRRTRWVPAGPVDPRRLPPRPSRSGRSAIIGVPDYRDLEHVVRALARVLPAEALARVDARQPNADRYRGFLRALEPRPAGRSSATRARRLAPAARLGLIALWDDGDPLHAEQHAARTCTPRCRAAAAGCRRGARSSSPATRAAPRCSDSSSSAGSGVRSRRRRQRAAVTPTAQQTGGDGPAAQARIPSAAWRVGERALEHGPVLIQVARPGYAPRLACAECGESARCRRAADHSRCAAAAPPRPATWCGVLAVDWACSKCEGTRWRPRGSGAPALPRSSAGPSRARASSSPTATRPPRRRRAAARSSSRPAAPSPSRPGGYRAVLLLDGERMLARESLRVVEDCVRWWCNAAALAARRRPGPARRRRRAPSPSARDLAQAEHVAAAELADRRTLRFPPAVRVAAIAGALGGGRPRLGRGRGLDGVDVLGPGRARRRPRARDRALRLRPR